MKGKAQNLIKKFLYLGGCAFFVILFKIIGIQMLLIYSFSATLFVPVLVGHCFNSILYRKMNI